MPRQNRPAARDSRLQTARKRTDRSYLRPAATPSSGQAEPEAETVAEPDAVADVLASSRPAVSGTSRVPASVRAIQQQGVRKRRDIDLQELAVSDTRQAIHDVRRISVLLVLVVIALVVLTILLR